MRFIILLLLIVHGNAYAQEIICEDDLVKKNYSSNQFVITECNCECTMQENTFFVYNEKKQCTIKISGASKIVINNKEMNENGTAINYFLSNKKNCIEDLDKEENGLCFFTLIPNDRGQYCYEYSAHLDTTGNLKVLKDYIDVQIIETIVSVKQYLYSENNVCSKTKMYLIKGDKVEILKEEGDWLFILYKGIKEIKKWIPKCSVE